MAIVKPAVKCLCPRVHPQTTTVTYAAPATQTATTTAEHPDLRLITVDWTPCPYCPVIPVVTRHPQRHHQQVVSADRPKEARDKVSRAYPVAVTVPAQMECLPRGSKTDIWATLHLTATTTVCYQMPCFHTVSPVPHCSLLAHRMMPCFRRTS